jgi:hypothetical protein
VDEVVVEEGGAHHRRARRCSLCGCRPWLLRRGRRLGRPRGARTRRRGPPWRATRIVEAGQSLRWWARSTEAPVSRRSAFVKVGDEVAEGQPLCILEAMKLMNEITAEEPGVIREIAVPTPRRSSTAPSSSTTSRSA